MLLGKALSELALVPATDCHERLDVDTEKPQWPGRSLTWDQVERERGGSDRSDFERISRLGASIILKLRHSPGARRFVGAAVKGFLLTLVCVAGIACGQVLFKKGALSVDTDGGLTRILLNPWIVVALIIYSTATLLWIHVLRETALSVAYPLFALTFVLVPLLSSLLLNEPLQLKTLVGSVLIVAGVYWSIQGRF